MKYRFNEKFLKKLVETPSPSGFEQPAQRVWKRTVSRFADRVYSDILGNAIGVINPEGKPTVMLSGHCDEIGLMVNYIDENGFIHVTGLIEASILPGQRLFIHTEKGKILGVVGKRPVHLSRKEKNKSKKPFDFKSVWIDIGAKNKKEAEKLVKIGDPITFAVGYEKLLNKLVVSRGFDDKIGSFIVAEVLRQLSKMRNQLKAGVCGVSSTQEEVGLRGIRPAAFEIAPQVGIVIDVTHAADSPAISVEDFSEIKLGKGPVISRGVITNPVIFRKLIEVAKVNNIPYQIAPSSRGYGTETYMVQLNRCGVATALISIPNRYMHTPVEVISLDDVKNTIKLLTKFILKLDQSMDFIPR